MPDKLKPKSVAGNLTATGLRIGIIISRFNSFITERLLEGALDALMRTGAKENQIEIIRVPGAFELPVAAKKLAQSHKPDSIICIGCVIRGETSHYEHVTTEAARGIQLAQIDTGVPIAFCVLTCDTLEQAIDRAGLKSGNKGFESGLAAVEMGNLSRQLRAASPPHSRSAAPAKSPRSRRR